MRKVHKRYKITVCVLTAICIAFLSGCGRFPQPETHVPKVNESPTETSSDPPPSGNEKEYLILAQEAQVLSIACGENARLDISLPIGVLGNDRILELIPLEGGDFIAPGFSLNEKGEKSLTLQAPAGICYVTSDELPENACIVKYSQDRQDTRPVPTQRFQWGKTSGIVAFVHEFSSYGVRVVSKEELSKMADEMERAGFHWKLRVDDKDGFTETNTDEWITGETIYEATLDMTLANTEVPAPYVMHGPYKGTAKMLSDVRVTMEGAPMFYSLVEATDEAAYLTLYPIFQEYEPVPGSGLPPLSGLIPVGYEGKGTLHMKDPKDLGGVAGEHGINLMEVARAFEQGGLDLPELQEEIFPVSIVTEGPMAYVTLALKEGRSVTFTGSITGVSAEQKMEIVPLIPDAEQKNKKAEKSKTTCTENEDGSYDYDMDGDGITDFTLYPLIPR